MGGGGGGAKHVFKFTTFFYIYYLKYAIQYKTAVCV